MEIGGMGEVAPGALLRPWDLAGSLPVIRVVGAWMREVVCIAVKAEGVRYGGKRIEVVDDG